MLRVCYSDYPILRAISEECLAGVESSHAWVGRRIGPVVLPDHAVDLGILTVEPGIFEVERRDHWVGASILQVDARISAVEARISAVDARNAQVGQFEAAVEAPERQSRSAEIWGTLATLGGRPPTEKNTKIVYRNVESVPPPWF